jgi:ATP-dependent Clp protease protease subunit
MSVFLFGKSTYWVLFILSLKGGGKVKKKVTAKRRFWAFKVMPNNEAELTIYGEIADSQGGWFSDGNEVTPTSFKAELDALGDITTLNVYINSPGGDVFAGQTIYSQLKRHKATVNMHIDGLAASIASVIAMAGDTIHIPVNAIVMIHHPISGVYGNATEMRAMADTLDKVCESIQETYLAKAPDLKRKDLVALLDAETWLTAQECFDLGLCDVVGEERAIAASVRDFEILAKYRNTPRFITVKAETDDPPEPIPPIEPDTTEDVVKAKAILALECEL